VLIPEKYHKHYDPKWHAIDPSSLPLAVKKKEDLS